MEIANSPHSEPTHTPIIELAREVNQLRQALRRNLTDENREKLHTRLIELSQAICKHPDNNEGHHIEAYRGYLATKLHGNYISIPAGERVLVIRTCFPETMKDYVVVERCRWVGGARIYNATKDVPYHELHLVSNSTSVRMLDFLERDKAHDTLEPMTKKLILAAAIHQEMGRLPEGFEFKTKD